QAASSAAAGNSGEQQLSPNPGLELSPIGDKAIEHGETPAPPSTAVLFRLWRFARPYRLQLLLGFVLTLASTAATLVPPYLTMPLMDEVLIPFQNGRAIDPTQVAWLLL